MNCCSCHGNCHITWHFCSFKSHSATVKEFMNQHDTWILVLFILFQGENINQYTLIVVSENQVCCIFLNIIISSFPCRVLYKFVKKVEGVVTIRAQEKKLLLTPDFQTEAVTCHSDVKIPLLCNIQIKYRV